MDVQPRDPTEEIKRLQRCINDLVSVLALPAVWSGGEPSQIIQSLLDALLRMLHLDFVYIRLKETAHQAAIEMVRFAPSQETIAPPQEIGDALKQWRDTATAEWPRLIRNPRGGGDISIAPLELGLQGEIGVLVAGSDRADFPRQTERLILSVAANQASIGLREAWFRSEQKRVATELDRQVAQRTTELAATNEKLRKEIADRKHAEVELRINEEKHRLIVEVANDAVISMNEEGSILFANPATRRIFGFDPSEIAGKPMTILMPEMMRKLHENGLKRYLATGKRHLNWQGVEVTAQRKDGREFPVEVSFGELTSDGHKVFTGFIRDISERKRAEEALRRSEAFLAEGQRLGQIGSYSWRVATNEIMWSDELYRIYELEIGAPITHELIRSRVHPEDVSLIEKMNTMDPGSEGGHEFEWQYRLLMPDHSIKYMHAVAHATRDQNGQLEYVASVQDVTARRLAEEARSELAHAARAISLGTLTASIAHEVNQPLTAITNNGNACLRLLANQNLKPDVLRGALEEIVADGARASGIITRIRSFLKKKPIENNALDLNEVIHETLALAGRELSGNRVKVELRLAPALPLVSADRVQMQQVLLNLIINGVEAMATDDDYPRLLQVESRIDESGDVLIAVCDMGTGLGSEPERIFTPFYTTKPNGMGMGLSISRSLVEGHGGRLWSAPNSPRGAIFSFTLPATTGSHS